MLVQHYTVDPKRMTGRALGPFEPAMIGNRIVQYNTRYPILTHNENLKLKKRFLAPLVLISVHMYIYPTIPISVFH